MDAVLDAGLTALERAHAGGVKIAYGSDLLGGMHRHQSRALSVILDGSPQPRGCMVTTAAIEAPPDDEETTAFARAVLTEQRTLLRAAIEAGRRTGDLPTGPDTPDAGQAADAIVALLNGVRVMQRVGAAPSSLVDMAMRLL